MNKKEAAMLLTLIKLSYPQAYRDYDDSWKKATIHMWESSFRDVPYAIIEQGFNHYRMNHGHCADGRKHQRRCDSVCHRRQA